ncbi:peptidoglycan-binding domain-containing protein [Ferrovibrio xuzhouensis]|uniref:Peptidoglycan-binding domain-containing protein n=1 Tax=Ferrovibrio xuzhouensis TaxID=1576914 RepID=A0ABV7VAK0_9PROT
MTAPANAPRALAPRALALRAPLGPDHVVEPEDILDAKQALGRLGYYRTADGSAPGAWVDSALFNGIRSFQRANNLKADGLIRPGGVTERAVNAALRTEEPPANDDEPPANDEEQHALRDCEQQRFLDEMKCGTLPNAMARAKCYSSSMQRYANCRHNGYPYPDLYVG